MNVNKAFLIGRVGHTPEFKEKSGVCTFSLATSKKYDGQETTQWHNCVTFKKNAENVFKYVQKGSLLHVEGEIQYQKYTGKDGTKKQRTEIYVNHVVFLDSKKEAGTAPRAATQEDDNSDIPF